MKPADLVALSLLPLSRRRLVAAVMSSDQLDGTLDTAVDLLRGASPLPDSAHLRGAADAALGAAAASAVTAITLGTPSYPPLLARIADPPLVLWMKGCLDALARPAVAIVGSRAACRASLEVAGSLARGLASRGVAVVSGLARGCDGAAHQGALAVDGATIAVLGSGTDIIYPPEHADLAVSIARHGAVLSELPPGTPPLPHHFPLRNRIISGLSVGIVVVQADERSGSLITAACGLEQGREVMAVPGGVPGGRNRGSHALLKDGALLVESAEDVLQGVPAFGHLLGTAPEAPAPADAPRPPQPEDPVLAALSTGEDLDPDQVSARCGLNLPTTLARLGTLELSGGITRLPGGRFVRVEGK
jgi:DNA processing protein